MFPRNPLLVLSSNLSNHRPPGFSQTHLLLLTKSFVKYMRLILDIRWHCELCASALTSTGPSVSDNFSFS